MTGYSLRDVVNDGPVRAPRWIHHLIKLATHTSLTFALWCFAGAPLYSAIVAGPVLWLLFVVHERIWPTDRQPLTAWQHIADWMTDGAIATAPVAGAVIATGDWFGGLLLLAGCLCAWMAGHGDARP
jgi:hypothetical protein